jgi:hypothetical protein
MGGSWQTESVRPEGAAFPINEITFAGGKYTATGLFSARGAYSGDRHTTTGAYSFNGTTLTLKPGKHTLQLLFADWKHQSFNPAVMSPKITITVK